MKLALAVAVLGLLAPPASAHLSAVTARSAEIAAFVWRYPCAAVGVHIRKIALPTNIAALVAQGYTPDGALAACHVYLNGRDRMNAAAECTVMVHEYGHLAGQHHKPPPSVMRAVLAEGPVFWRCAQVFGHIMRVNGEVV